MDFEFTASDTMKHSAAHVMGAAVKRIFPSSKVGIGPVTKTGFYYDFEIEEKFSEKNFAAIESAIEKIITEGLLFKQFILPKQEAVNLLLQIGEIYKAELVETIDDEQISLFKLGEEFIDPDRGPHLQSSKEVGKIKLTKVEKVNWNNDASRPTMYRIHGVVFNNITEFNNFTNYLNKSKELLFDNVVAKNSLGEIINKEITLNIDGVNAVHSLEKYILNNFEILKPVKIKADTTTSISKKTLSYKALPQLYYYYESEETLVNETKKISFDVDKLKMILVSDNVYVYDNINSVIEIFIDLLNKITKENINADIYSSEVDGTLVKSISSLLQNKIISHDKILDGSSQNEILISIKAKDELERSLEIVQFKISNNANGPVYTNHKNEKLHSFVLNIELSIYNLLRFILTENYKMPFEINSKQIIILPIRKEQFDYSKAIYDDLWKLGFNVSLDLRSKSFNSKIADAEKKQFHFIFVIGKKEEENKSVSVRLKSNQVGLIALDEILEYIRTNSG